MDLAAFLRSLDEELERKIAETVDLSDTREKALLISVGQASRQEMEDALDELAELARTADVVVLDRVLQRARQINPKYLMGEGKIKEVVIHALQRRATLLIFDQDLSPAQVRSISGDHRAQGYRPLPADPRHLRPPRPHPATARCRWSWPSSSTSCRGWWARGRAFSRLMGGIGGRGPGETKLEIDRRRIRDRISRLEKQLESLARGRRQRRQRRIRAGVPIVSIVGYTNAGKSTLLNALTQSEVLTEDLLFATLDTSTRRLRFPREREVIITDTVGFIRQLPKSLLGAFKATLEELEDADLLLHVVDLSNPRFEEQIRSVERILQDLELDRIPRLLVFNKTDLVPEEESDTFCRRFQAIAVSARNPRSFEPLLAELESRFWPGGAGTP